MRINNKNVPSPVVDPSVYNKHVYLYTTISDAINKLKERQKDRVLEEKINTFWGDNKPNFISNEPVLFFARSIITPNFEVSYFLDIVKTLGIRAVMLEYPDKFVAKNKTKYYFCNVRFCDKDSLVCPDTIKIVDFNNTEGKQFDDINILTGKNIITFYKEWFDREFPEHKNDVINFKEWFNSTRNLSEYYYLYYLSLFLRNGILFENFLWKDQEEIDFVKSKVEPSFNKIKELFGVEPIIVPLLPIEHESNEAWFSYPIAFKESFDIYYNNKK